MNVYISCHPCYRFCEENIKKNRPITFDTSVCPHVTTRYRVTDFNEIETTSFTKDLPTNFDFNQDWATLTDTFHKDLHAYVFACMLRVTRV
jgi:hypothetical protein